MQGNKMISAIIRGNSIVQQNDISWSYLILGYEALVHINIKIIIQDLTPRTTLCLKPSTKGLPEKVWSSKLPIRYSGFLDDNIVFKNDILSEKSL